tara:strand:+ start:5022 stop:6158 length:1137 start_codon:yes stop_codon:yes gene_type:complete
MSRFEDLGFSFNKVIYFIKLWGLRSTLIKAIGRTRQKIKFTFPFYHQDITIFGCGQFAFSTLAPRLLRFGLFSPVKYCFDVNLDNSSRLARAYSAKSANLDTIYSNPTKILFIASDHKSHYNYIVDNINRFEVVYCEKPITLNSQQAFHLANVIPRSQSTIFFGYNRPLSPAISRLRSYSNLCLPSKLHGVFVIKGHFLDPSHWYNDPSQSSRIFGNVCHWLDLAIHMSLWIHEVEEFQVNITRRDDSSIDTNLNIQLLSPDISFDIVFNAMLEPFSGVHETLDISTDKYSARIDNFRSLEIDTGSGLSRVTYRKKMCGHDQAIAQPFSGGQPRPWSESLLCEIMCDQILQCVLASESSFTFKFSEIRRRLLSNQNTF